MNEILEYLKTHGETLDVDIAKGAGFPLAKTRLYLAELESSGQIVTYHSTRFLEGQKIEGIRCQLSWINPKDARGRKKRKVS